MHFGLLGWQISHSYSPKIHSLLGSYPYSLFDVPPDQLGDFLKSTSFDGLNVTIPYKKSVIPLLTKLTPEAQNMLVNYYWRGNIRQLKNVTEQISVIEQNREIDATTLQNYLPQQHESNLPTIFGQQQHQEERSFANEREILLQQIKKSSS